MTKPWYHEGLRFECTRCGKCCSGFPGYVWVTPEEIAAIAEYLGELPEIVEKVYTRVVHGEVTLRDKANDDCVFYDPSAGCTIYPVRPAQCRTWPFWESTTQSPAAWEKTKTLCPGAGNGTLITAEEITRRVRTIRM